MNRLSKGLPLSELGFIKIWTALTVENNDGDTLNREQLEKDLYSFHSNFNYSHLFNDIVFIKPETEEPYADLYHGFVMGYVAEILDNNNDNNSNTFPILIDLDKANEILSSYEDDILIPMIRLYDEIKLLNHPKKKTRSR